MAKRVMAVLVYCRGKLVHARFSRCPACGYYGWNGVECFDCGYWP